MVTVDVNFLQNDNCFEIIYQAHIFKNSKFSEQSWIVNENILYLQPDKQLLEKSLKEDEIYSIIYNMQNPNERLLFSLPIYINGEIFDM
jgi:hypothetical protein